MDLIFYGSSLFWEKKRIKTSSILYTSNEFWFLPDLLTPFGNPRHLYSRSVERRLKGTNLGYSSVFFQTWQVLSSEDHDRPFYLTVSEDFDGSSVEEIEGKSYFINSSVLFRFIFNGGIPWQPFGNVYYLPFFNIVNIYYIKFLSSLHLWRVE